MHEREKIERQKHLLRPGVGSHVRSGEMPAKPAQSPRKRSECGENPANHPAQFSLARFHSARAFSAEIMDEEEITFEGTDDVSVNYRPLLLIFFFILVCKLLRSVLTPLCSWVSCCTILQLDVPLAFSSGSAECDTITWRFGKGKERTKSIEEGNSNCQHHSMSLYIDTHVLSVTLHRMTSLLTHD